MVRIPDTTFKNWQDGEVVNAADYIQELEIIRAAINGTDDDVSVLKAAGAGVIKGIPYGTTFPSNPKVGDVVFRTDLDLFYVLGVNEQWKAFSPKAALDAHVTNIENPHNTTASQVGAYTKTESDTKFVQVTNGIGLKVFTNELWFQAPGNTNSVAQSGAFPDGTFTTPPIVLPGNVFQAMSYSDVLLYPYIYNVTTSGYWVKIHADAGANIGAGVVKMNFVIIGR